MYFALTILTDAVIFTSSPERLIFAPHSLVLSHVLPFPMPASYLHPYADMLPVPNMVSPHLSERPLALVERVEGPVGGDEGGAGHTPLDAVGADGAAACHGDVDGGLFWRGAGQERKVRHVGRTHTCLKERGGESEVAG